MNETNIMVDLESMGTNPGAMILSIGAVKFDPRTKKLGDEFHMRILMEDSVQYGFGIAVETMRWWLLQSEAAKQAAMDSKDAQPVKNVLGEFYKFCTGLNQQEVEAIKDVAEAESRTSGVKMWGNGASFDNTLLSAYYIRVRMVQPWKFYNDCCYRTVKNAYRHIKLTRIGTHHNALDDAKSQALHLMDIIKATNYGGYNDAAG